MQGHISPPTPPSRLGDRLAARLMNLPASPLEQNETMELLKGAPLAADGYHNFVFQWNEAFFQKRVEMVGFVGAGNVFDAGCGLGQWTSALARCNRSVVAVDRNPAMVETTRLLCERRQQANVTVASGQLPDLGYPDGSFDFIWCSLVLEYVDRDASMDAFRRLLKRGGRLYVSTNSRGRWLVKALAGVLKVNRPLFATSLKTAIYGNRPEAVPNFLLSRDVSAHCARHGFELLGVAPEGCLDLTGNCGRELPMFPKRLLGLFEQNIEFVAQRI